MAWIKTRERLPEVGRVVKCRLQHWNQESTQEHNLIRVDEGDCDWRTEDYHSEISFNWNVVEWEED